MKPIVAISDLHVRLRGERTVHALNGVDLSLEQGDVLGLLGESGSDKSVTLRATTTRRVSWEAKRMLDRLHSNWDEQTSMESLPFMLVEEE
jgi:ABC-type dipeptide/oligopeptide/nickel transport system ATPase component